MTIKGKRARITPDGRAYILTHALLLPRIPRTKLAEQLQKELEAEGYDRPEVEVLERKISWFRNHATDDPQDKFWNLSTLEDFPIPADALPSVLKAWLHNQEERKAPLTIREAKWVARLYPFYDDTPLRVPGACAVARFAERS